MEITEGDNSLWLMLDTEILPHLYLLVLVCHTHSRVKDIIIVNGNVKIYLGCVSFSVKYTIKNIFFYFLMYGSYTLKRRKSF